MARTYVPRKEVYATIKLTVAERLPELAQFVGAPSVSKLIEQILEQYVEEMDSVKKSPRLSLVTTESA